MENQRLLMRVVVNDDDIRKLVLNERPNSIEELKAHMKEKLPLQYDFILQYEDKDFDNALCNLTHITDLPEKATLKVIPLVTLELLAVTLPVTSSGTDCSSTDTDILPPTETPLRRQWPEFFDIPNFSVDVEYRLRQADLAFLKDLTRMSLPRDMKHDILEKLAEAMYSFKAYPDDDDYTSVSKSLISKHPSLTEPGPQPGYYGWKNSLKFKMGNYRTKLRRAGCEDVIVNGGKRSKNNPEGESSRKNIKRPKRGEANYLPNLPNRQNEEGLESARMVLVEEIKKKQHNGSLISNMMDQTFSLRRQEIVKKEPAVQDIVERWPALFTEGQVFAEFSRIANKHLESSFFESLDKHTPRIIELLQSKKGAAGQKIQELMANLSPDVTARRSVVLKGLPMIFGDDPNRFYKTCFETTKDEAIDDVTVGVLTILSEDDPEQPFSTAIILEGGIVMDKIRDLPQAVCLIFGLTYALNLDYPKCVGNTFRFIQSVMLGLGNKALTPKLLTVKNMLFDE